MAVATHRCGIVAPRHSGYIARTFHMTKKSSPRYSHAALYTSEIGVKHSAMDATARRRAMIRTAGCSGWSIRLARRR